MADAPESPAPERRPSSRRRVKGGDAAAARPFADAKAARKAAEQFVLPTTREHDRVRILQRLRASGALAETAVPVLLGQASRQDVHTRHAVLDLVGVLIEAGVPLDDQAEELARCLTDSNFALREKATGLLVALGPKAEGAVNRLVACLGNPLKEVRLAALAVLRAIGPACASKALPRLERLLKTVSTAGEREVLDAAAETFSALVGEEVPEETVSPSAETTPEPAAPKTAEAATGTESPPSPAGTGPLREARVLVMEESAPLQRRARRILTRHGARAEFCQDAASALKALASACAAGRPFALLMTSLRGGTMSVPDLVQHLRDNPSLRSTAVLLFVASEDAEPILQCARHGIAGVVSANTRDGDILLAVERALGMATDRPASVPACAGLSLDEVARLREVLLRTLAPDRFPGQPVPDPVNVCRAVLEFLNQRCPEQ